MSSPRRNHNPTHCPFVNDCGAQLQTALTTALKGHLNRRAPKAAFISLSFHRRRVLSRFSAAAQASLHRPAPRTRSRATLIPLLRPLDRRKGFENTHRQHHQRRESPNPAARVSRQVPRGNRSCASCACRIANPEWGGRCAEAKRRVGCRRQRRSRPQGPAWATHHNRHSTAETQGPHRLRLHQKHAIAILNA